MYVFTLLQAYAHIQIHLLPFTSHGKRTRSTSESREAEGRVTRAGKGTSPGGRVPEIGLATLITRHGSRKLPDPSENQRQPCPSPAYIRSIVPGRRPCQSPGS